MGGRACAEGRTSISQAAAPAAGSSQGGSETTVSRVVVLAGWCSALPPPTPEGALCSRSPPLTTEAFPAGAHVAAGHVPAGAAVDAGVRLTLVVVNVAVGPTPPRVTVTLIPAGGTTPRLRGGPGCVGLGCGHFRLCHSPRLVTGRRRCPDPYSPWKWGNGTQPAHDSGKALASTRCGAAPSAGQ